MAKIGLITSQDVSARNMEHVTFRIAEILETRHDLTLLCTKQASPRIQKNFHLFPCPDKGTPLGWRLRHIRRYVREERPDLLISLSSIGINGLAAAWTGRKTGIPTAVRLTSDVFQVWKTEPSARRKLRLFIRNNLLGQMAMRLADKVVILHDTQKRGLNLPPEKLYTVPQPVTFPDTRTAPIRKNLGIPEDAYVVGSMMRLDDNKRTDLLVEIIEKSPPDTWFLIAGDGTKKPWLQKKLENTGHVIFAGEIPRDDLAGYYKSCDVVLHLSKSEGLSNVIAEALYFQKPVLATDSGAITRALTRNICRTTDEFSEKIEKRSAVIDSLPDNLKPQNNSALWLDLVDCLVRAEQPVEYRPAA